MCVCMDAWMEMCAGWDGVAGTAPQRPESSVAVVRSVESTREMGHAARGRLGREACKTLYRTLLVRRNVVLPYCVRLDTVDTLSTGFTPYSTRLTGGRRRGGDKIKRIFARPARQLRRGG